LGKLGKNPVVLDAITELRNERARFVAEARAGRLPGLDDSLASAFVGESTAAPRRAASKEPR